MKKILSILLSFIMVITALPLTAISSFAEISGAWEYMVFQDETVRITGYTGLESNLTIPSTIAGKTVTEIGSYAFYGNTSLVNVNLPNSLVSIDGLAFGNCTSLMSVSIPKSLKYADTYLYNSDGPFANCDNLKNITFENGITKIASCLFAGCTGIENITIPNTVTSIGGWAFYSCQNLKMVSISNSVTEIGDNAFGECENLTSVNLPNRLKNLGGLAFGNCTSLMSINIPKSLEYGDYYLYPYNGPFANCENLKNITFENGITKIASLLFAGCTGIENITIPNSVTTIGNFAFYSCQNLKTVSISDTVTEIGDNAFCECENLTNVTLPKSLVSLGGLAFGSCTSLASINIPKSLEYCNYYSYLNNGPFANCDNLKNITFENGITKIVSLLFAGCTGIESITIPNTVTTIGNFAFYFCENLKNISVPDSVVDMGEYVFSNCSSLESATLPSEWTYISEGLFSDCTSLNNIDFSNDNSELKEIRTGAFYNCQSLEEAVLPENLEEIGENAFRGCNDVLSEVIIPGKVNYIGSGAFADCTVLESVYIPHSVKYIGDEAFACDEFLYDVTIEDYSIKNIYSGTFKDCPSLQSIVLPKGLEEIGDEAFMNDTGLNSVTIYESVNYIESSAFSYPKLTTIYGVAGSYAHDFAIEGGFRFSNIYSPAEGFCIYDDNDYIVIDRGDVYHVEFEYYPDFTTDIVTIETVDPNELHDFNIELHDIKPWYSGDYEFIARTSSGLEYPFTIHVRGIDEIQVAQEPLKTVYNTGEELDLSGLVVEVIYDDGTTKEVTDYKVSGFDSSVEGEQDITISWTAKDGWEYETYLTVEVVSVAPKLIGICVKDFPTKIEYARRDALDLTGLVVVGSYSDGSMVEITDYKTSGYNSLKNGIQTVTITADGLTTNFKVYVGQSYTGCHHENTQVYPATASTCITPGTGMYCLCLDCGEVVSGSKTALPLVEHKDKDCDDYCDVCGFRCFVLGDVDEDGEFTISDYAIIKDACVGLIELEDWEFAACDLNFDGAVDAFDLFQYNLYMNDIADIYGNKY